MAILTFQNVSFQYPMGKKQALSEISFSVEEGEFILLAGSSGCGKSTLLRQIKPELSSHGELTGDIIYKETPIKQLLQRASASEIGFVAQDPYHQVVTDKVWHELAFGLENLGLSQNEIRIRVSEMASFFGIGDWFDRDTDTLSGGQLQLLNLAAVMAMHPKVLLLDEPTAQLDPIATENFVQVIKKINRDLGITVIIAEHDLEELFSFADKVAVLREGKLVSYDFPKQVAKELRDHKDDTALILPTPLFIYQKLRIEDEPPLTIRQGRTFLSKHFGDSQTIKLPKERKENNPDVTVELKDISFRYGKELADCLNKVSLRAYRGENLSIVGENGTGKSTLLSVIANLLSPYRGTCIINGEKQKRGNGNKAIGMLPQDPQSLFLMETVYDDLYQTFHKQEQKLKIADAKIKMLLEKLSIVHLLDFHPYDLSGGEQQRVALAKVLLQDPEILLLDEPTKGIDAASKQTLGKLLQELAALGKTVIIVTHDIEFAAQFSNQCAMLFRGEIVSRDCPQSFFGNHSFYTTAANKMSRHLYQNAVTKEDVIALCQMNMSMQNVDD